MAKFKMKYFGSTEGLKSKKTYHFDKDQIIEAPEGDIPMEAGEIVTGETIDAPKTAEKATEEPAKVSESADANPEGEPKKKKGFFS